MIQVGVVMGSNSDWEVMQNAARVLKDFGVAFETRVVSAHRTPDLLFEYAETAEARGLQAIIAGAGGAAHLPGMLAAKTHIPVLGVPVPSKYLRGVGGAGLANGEGGHRNAALFAVAMLANQSPELAAALKAFRQKQADTVLAMTLPEVL